MRCRVKGVGHLRQGSALLHCVSQFRVQDLEGRVRGEAFRALRGIGLWALGCRIYGLGCRGYSVGFRAQLSGYRFQDLGVCSDQWRPPQP